MEIGYASVSALVQTLDRQIGALRQAGCERIFTDAVSGARAERKGLAEALSLVCAGDMLMVWRLDCIGCSLPHLLAMMKDLHARGIGFKSLIDEIDTTSNGEQILHLFGVLAELERNLIRERAQRGLVTARQGPFQGPTTRAQRPADRPGAHALRGQQQLDPGYLPRPQDLAHDLMALPEGNRGTQWGARQMLQTSRT